MQDVAGEVRDAHLYARLGQVDLERELLARVDVWVMRLGEHALQLLKLRAREGGADPPLLPLLVQAPVVGEEFVGNCPNNKQTNK